MCLDDFSPKVKAIVSLVLSGDVEVGTVDDSRLTKREKKELIVFLKEMRQDASSLLSLITKQAKEAKKEFNREMRCFMKKYKWTREQVDDYLLGE